MARGRMLNRTVSGSIKLHLLSDDTARLMATWLLPYLDVNGVTYGDAAMVRSMVFPRRGDITVEQVEDYLKEMVSLGLIYLFYARGDVWQCWPGFADNQPNLRSDRETTSFPAPPPDARAIPAQFPRNSREMQEVSGQDAGGTPAEVKLSEVKLSEVKKDAQERGLVAPPPEEAQSEPSTPPKKLKRTRKPPTPVPEAVKVFRENAHRFPAKSWYDRIADVVGEDRPDLVRWGETVHAWVGMGWKPTNAKGMLECYQKGEVPGQNRRSDGRGDKVIEEMDTPTGWVENPDWDAYPKEEGAPTVPV